MFASWSTSFSSNVRDHPPVPLRVKGSAVSGSDHIPSNEITPPELYFNRRAILKVAAAAATLVTTGAVYRRLNRAGVKAIESRQLTGVSIVPANPNAVANGFRTDEAMSTLD